MLDPRDTLEALACTVWQANHPQSSGPPWVRPGDQVAIPMLALKAASAQGQGLAFALHDIARAWAEERQRFLDLWKTASIATTIPTEFQDDAFRQELLRAGAAPRAPQAGAEAEPGARPAIAPRG